MARTIHFEGRTISVPDDATDDEIRSILEPPQETPSWGGAVQRGLSRGAQASAEGVGLMAGGLPDLVSMPINAGAALVNRAAGTNLPQIPSISERFGQQYREGVAEAQDPNAYGKRKAQEAQEGGLSSWLPDSPFRIAGNIAGRLSAVPVDVSKLSTPERLAYNTQKIGTAVLGGSALGGMRSAVQPGAVNPIAASGAPGGLAADSFAANVLKDVVAPARQVGAKTMAGDVGAGAFMAGADTLLDANKEALDRSGIAGKLVQGLAPLASGMAGGATAGLATSAVGRARRVLSPEPGLPIDPQTGRPYPAGVVDRAAAHAQESALDPITAANRLDESVSALRGQGVEIMPTSGALSGDTGLVGTERAYRSNAEGSARFSRHDQRVDTEAAGRVRSVAADGDANLPGQFAQQQAATRRQAATDAIAEAERRAGAHDQLMVDEAGALAARGDSARREAAAAAVDRAVVDEGLRPATADKNARFDAIDPDGTLMRPGEPLFATTARVREAAEAIPAPLRGDVLPEKEIAAIEGHAPRIVQRETGLVDTNGRPLTVDVNEGGTGQIPMRSITEMVPLLSAAESRARAAGQYGMADNVRALRQEMGRETDRLALEGNPAAQAAQSSYVGSYAPVWARGPGDEAARFRRDYNRDPANRITTPPSETAGRFLSSPEKAQALARIIESSADPAAGHAAARDYVLSDLARSGAIDRATGRINLGNLRRWVADNGATAEAIPGLRAELEGISRQAADRQVAAERLAGELRGARDRARLTDADIDGGVLGMMLGRDPHHLVEGLLSSKNPRQSLRDVVNIFRESPEAMRGLARAIGQYVEDSATGPNTARTLDGSRPVSVAKLENLMTRFGDALAEALPPGEMNKLRATQTQLAPRQALSLPVAGSTIPGRSDRAAAAVGAVPGLPALARLLLSAVPDHLTPRANALMVDALENPETFAELLRRDMRKQPAANWRANAALGGVLGSQNSRQ